MYFISLRVCFFLRAPQSQVLARLGKKQFGLVVVCVFFSASSVLGSRPGSVGVGVSGCPGCAWVFNPRVPGSAHSLFLSLSPSSQYLASSFATSCAGRFGVVVTVRHYQGQVFLQVRGAKPVLLAVAKWWGQS